MLLCKFITEYMMAFVLFLYTWGRSQFVRTPVICEGNGTNECRSRAEYYYGLFEFSFTKNLALLTVVFPPFLTEKKPSVS